MISDLGESIGRSILPEDSVLPSPGRRCPVIKKILQVAAKGYRRKHSQTNDSEYGQGRAQGATCVTVPSEGFGWGGGQERENYLSAKEKKKKKRNEKEKNEQGTDKTDRKARNTVIRGDTLVDCKRDCHLKLESKVETVLHEQFPLEIFHPLDNIDLMNRDHMTLQARLLSETVAAVEAGKLAFSSAFPIYVPPQVTEHRVASAALLTGESRPCCQMKKKNTTVRKYHQTEANRTIGISRNYRFSDTHTHTHIYIYMYGSF